MKSRGEKSPRREEKKKEDLGRERVRRQKMQVREKVEKSRNTFFSNDLWLRRVEKYLAKAAGAEPCGQMRDEKLHAVVTRSTFRSQNVQNTLQLRSTLLEVEVSKKCTPLWREAHFKVKMYKPHHSRTTSGSWDVEKVRPVVACCGAKHMSKSKVKKLRGTEHFWTFRCHFAWQAQGIVCLVKSEETWGFRSSFKYNHPLHYTTPHYTTNYSYNCNCATLHYATLH